MKNLTKLYDLFLDEEKKRIIFLTILVIINALIETIGIASIFPFIAILTNPEIIETNFFLNLSYAKISNFKIITIDQFLFVLGILSFIIFIISLIFKSFATYKQAQFNYLIERDFGKRLLQGYFNHRYSWILNKDISNIGKNLLNEVANVKSGIISPVITLLSQAILSISIIILLFILNPAVAINISIAFLIVYVVIFLIVRKILIKLGEDRLEANKQRFLSVFNAFNAFKLIKLKSVEKVFIKIFYNYSDIYLKNEAKGLLISQLPRYFIEGLAFGGMLIIILFLIGTGNDLSNIIPLLAVYGFSGYRLLPAFQLMYNSFSQIRFSLPSFEMIYNEYKSIEKIKSEKNYNEDIVNFSRNIKFTNLEFSYPHHKEKILRNINLNIQANKKIGIIGHTGSGKSTLLDILLGLLDVDSGLFQIDDKIININNVKSWQSKIGYVPQDIYLMNDTIFSNIAFGIDIDKIDYDQVLRSAKIANIHDFINDELPKKYSTIVGERGTRLSGGQIQRIGIARALYNKPSVLIFDEGTSALDNITERNIIKNLDDIKDQVTIIMSTHRINSLREFDKIILLEKGKIEFEGTYSYLIKNSKSFNNIINSN